MFRIKIDIPLCGQLYKKDDGSLVTCLGIYPDAKMNCFTWSKEDNDSILPGDYYNKELNNWQGPIHIVKLSLQTFNENRKTEYTCTKYSVSDKFNGFPI